MCHDPQIFLELQILSLSLPKKIWCNDNMVRAVHYIGMGCLYVRLLGALVLHRDGMPICEATRCAGVTSGWDAYM